MRWLLAGLALSVLVACGTTSQDPSAGGGGAAADFSFTTFEGDEFTAAERRGTPVVLNFWESW